MCKLLGVLPRAGGLLDQDIKYLRMLKAGLQALGKKESHEMEMARRR